MLTTPGPLEISARELPVAHSIVMNSFVCDLSRPESIQGLVAETQRVFGGLDVLINAAAVLGPALISSDDFTPRRIVVGYDA